MANAIYELCWGGEIKAWMTTVCRPNYWNRVYWALRLQYSESVGASSDRAVDSRSGFRTGHTPEVVTIKLYKCGKFMLIVVIWIPDMSRTLPPPGFTSTPISWTFLCTVMYLPYLKEILNGIKVLYNLREDIILSSVNYVLLWFLP